MMLELSEADARALREVLDTYLLTMLEELAHTDTRAYRDTLRERYDRLDAVRRHLDAALDGNQVYA